MTIVPAKGRDGKLTPKAIAMTAPSDAPDDTPSVEPSARVFLKSPCMAAPASTRAAPVRATHSTRGSRTGTMTERARLFSEGRPFTASQITLKISLAGMLTLPRQRHSKKTAIVTVTMMRYIQV